MKALCIISFALYASLLVSSQTVPVLIWSDQSVHHLETPVAGHTLKQNNFAKQYLDKLTDKKHNLLVFIQDKLSLEDITQNADVYDSDSDGGTFHNLKELFEEHSSMHLPSVSHPDRVLAQLQQTYAAKVHQLDAPYRLTDLPLNPDGGDMVVIHLPPTGNTDAAFKENLQTIDGILGSVTREARSLGKPFTAIYTANRSSKVQSESLYLGRHLLAEPDDNSTFIFINVTECLYLYYDYIQVKLNGETVNSTLEREGLTHEGSCSTGGNGTATLTLSYAKVVPELEALSLRLEFNSSRSWWSLSSSQIVYDNKTYSDPPNSTVASQVSAPLGFSYHCTVPACLKKYGENNQSIELQFYNLQLQALGIKNSGKFGTANDCVAFFTIPILSGLIAALLLITILTFGVVMLANINTLDRFDDPKGKTITVNISE